MTISHRFVQGRFFVLRMGRNSIFPKIYPLQCAAASACIKFISINGAFVCLFYNREKSLLNFAQVAAAKVIS
jgi:hypothetical protein